eukprot:jgi/Psemu1/45729/gm1.45729_g
MESTKAHSAADREQTERAEQAWRHQADLARRRQQRDDLARRRQLLASVQRPREEEIEIEFRELESSSPGSSGNDPNKLTLAAEPQELEQLLEDNTAADKEDDNDEDSDMMIQVPPAAAAQVIAAGATTVILDFEGWYSQEFLAHASRNKYDEMVSDKLHPDLPAKEALNGTQWHSMAYSAFHNNNAGNSIIEKSKIDREGSEDDNTKLILQWPRGRVHQIFGELIKLYQRTDTVDKIQLNMDLKNIKIRMPAPQYVIWEKLEQTATNLYSAGVIMRGRGASAKEMSLFGAEMTRQMGIKCYLLLVSREGHKDFQCSQREAGHPKIDRDTKRGCPKCNICGDRHADKNYWEDDKNASCRPPEWKTRLEDVGVQGATIDFDFYL